MGFLVGILGRLLGPVGSRAVLLGGRSFPPSPGALGPLQLRTLSTLSRALAQPPGILQPIPAPVPLPPWSLQQVRFKARGNEYQPNNRKRKKTHGWIKRLSTPAGVKVILRRMLKGRKYLTH
ncbi:39S ribosomal protein L34, mitochondrial [Tachyglossus aculeatus]|uniref:39S ribosomal protein L34, mitochondrial n=1 Tax=Tachyglossus aculeatus TaxID=9261 RepID=UPI0018F6E9B8|nr:39S ribosomal protein L34, mitochondrial [Tachyglossus aculeatus]